MNQFDVGDQVFKYHGPHSLQFGVTVQRIHDNHDFGQAKRGEFQFPDLRSFLTGTPRQFRAPLPGSNDATKAYRRIYFAGFLQDDYKLKPNLTLNLGLRYELMTVPTEVTGRISNFRYHFVNGSMLLDSTPHLGDPFFQGSHDLFAPRVGFAWDPRHNGKTALRGGFGIFYEPVDWELRFFAGGNPPSYSQTIATTTTSRQIQFGLKLHL